MDGVGYNPVDLPYSSLISDSSNALCKIEEGLFLGSVEDARNKEALQSANITHILTLALFVPPFYPKDFLYKVFEVVDNKDTDLAQHFDECFTFIDEAKKVGGNVFVHCYMGISRSVTIVVAYLMKKNGLSLAEALKQVKRTRPQAHPNSGFISQLQRFESSLQGNNREMGIGQCQS